MDKTLSLKIPRIWETELFLQGKHHDGHGPSYLQAGNTVLSQHTSVVPLLQRSHTAELPQAVILFDHGCCMVIARGERYLDNFACLCMEVRKQPQDIKTREGSYAKGVSLPRAKDARTRSGAGCFSR